MGLVGGHLVECMDLSSESTNGCSEAHQVIVVDRKEEYASQDQVYIPSTPHPPLYTSASAERH